MFAGELLEDLIAADFAAGIGREQASGFDPEQLHKGEFARAFRGNGAIEEAGAGRVEEKFMRPLGLFVSNKRLGRFGEGAGFGGSQDDGKFRGQLDFGAEALDEGGLFFAVDGSQSQGSTACDQVCPAGGRMARAR